MVYLPSFGGFFFMVNVGSSDGMMQYSYPGNSAIVTLSLQHHVNVQITKYQSL